MKSVLDRHSDRHRRVVKGTVKGTVNSTVEGTVEGTVKGTVEGTVRKRPPGLPQGGQLALQEGATASRCAGAATPGSSQRHQH